MSKSNSLPLLSLFTLLSGSFSATTFTISNLCPDTVWPGLLSGAGTPPLSPSGFSLNSGDSRSLQIPPSWSGRLWARTHCSSDPTTSKFTCATGDCGSGLTDCSGHGADPPATLAEFTLDGSDGLDFFDVSLVDGYNLPMIITPVGVTGGGGNCTATGCAVDLNGSCPSDLRVVLSGSEGRGVACRSACEAFDTPEFCCSGDYGNPKTCRPSSYSEFFKEACPQAYSYAYDDASSTFTCPAGGNYLITFCPGTSRLGATWKKMIEDSEGESRTKPPLRKDQQFCLIIDVPMHFIPPSPVLSLAFRSPESVAPLLIFNQPVDSQ